MRLSDVLSKPPAKEYVQIDAFLQNKAMQAYTDGLGAGAVVYLRKIFEKITVKTAKAVDIEYAQYEGGNPKNFSELLKNVDEKCSIIPKEFSANGYNLFRELSGSFMGSMMKKRD